MANWLIFLLMVICALWGFGLGFYTAHESNLRKAHGKFIINHSDPTKDLCQLELEKDLDEIEKGKVLVLKVEIIK